MKRLLFTLLAIGFVGLGYVSYSHGLFLLFAGVTVATIIFAFIAKKNVALTLAALFAMISLFSWLGTNKIFQITEPQAVQAAVEEVVQPQPVVPVVIEEVATGCVNQYPEAIQPWCGLIETSAQEYGLDPLLITSVMLQESGGQPEVMSSAGAVGLLQVMPRDGISANFQCINGPCFSNRPTIQELKDPAFNVDYGSKMLAGLTAKWGSIREALFHYGPSGNGYIYADKVLSIYANLTN